MCSVSWLWGQGSYELVFNRDEKWARPLSLDCKFETQHRVPGFCARDSEANGTWLFTNEMGITLALLNGYPSGLVPPSGKRTRGQLALLAAEAESEESLIGLLKNKNYSEYAPFHLLLFSESGVWCFTWDGSVFGESAMGLQPFFTSSSVDNQRVIAVRNKRFKRIRHLPLLDILSDTEAAQSADAIYVTRKDGGTVSQTVVQVSQSRIQFSVTRRGETQSIQSAPRKWLTRMNGR